MGKLTEGAALLWIMSPLYQRGFPSWRLTFQPDPEDIFCSVDVTIMRRATLRTYPRPHAERAHAFGAAVGNTPAAMTRSGSVHLVDLKKCCLPSGRLVPQHFLKHVPARVQDRFSHLGLGEFGTAHVTDDDQFIFTGNPGGCDVQMVFARIGDLGVDRTDAFLVSGPLRPAQGFCVFPVMLESGNGRAVATGRHRLQAEIDTDLAGTRFLGLNFTLKNDVPATTSILGETAGFDGAGKLAVLPKTYSSPSICQGRFVNTNVAPLKRNPTKAFAAAKTASKSWASSRRVSGLHKGSADFTDRIGGYFKLSSRARGKVNQVKSGWPLNASPAAPLGFRLPLRFTEIVPDVVTGPRMSI